MFLRLLSAIFFYFCINTMLYAAEDFVYDLHISNDHPTVKEGITLTLDINQTSTNEVMRFVFMPPKSDAFTVQLLQGTETKDSKDRTHARLEYALFPLKTGTLKTPLTLIVKRTTKEELKKFVTGSADELMYLRTVDTSVPIRPVILNVRPLPRDVDLVGDYQLDYAIDTNKTTPDKQINLTYTLKGYGYPPHIKEILPKIPNVKIFIEKESFDNKLFHKINFHYALIADQTFTLPEISLKAYNPRTNQIYTLAAPAAIIKVKKTSEKSLGNNHIITEFSWQEYRIFLIGILLFFTGFMTAKLITMIPKRHMIKDKKTLFIRDIHKAKTPKALLKLLLTYDRREFSIEIEEIEELLYFKQQQSLSHLKQQILQKVNQSRDYLNI